MERLRQLLVLTVADIRAVGPKTWNGWKAQLLRDLFNRTEEYLSGGLIFAGREREIDKVLGELKGKLADWPAEDIEAHLERGHPGYWLSFPMPILERHARLVREAEIEGRSLSVDFRVDAWEAMTEVTIYVPDRAGLVSQLAGACALTTAGPLAVARHSDGAYAVLRFAASCAHGMRRLKVDYRLLFDLDPSHRGLLRIEVDGSSSSAVMAPDRAVQEFELAQASGWRTFTQFAGDGMHHILVGYDHMLFLISLLLPAVLVRRERRWQPVPSLRAALLGVLAVVTAFTVSHSITLTLAALDIVGLPSRLVESGIALSVLLAAVNNIRPVITRRAWLLAFGFGLVHGFGFASVLADLGLPRGALTLALAGFNVGVELGQIAVVLAVVPVIYFLRNARFYRPGILVGGSSAIALIAGIWFLGRALGLGLG